MERETLGRLVAIRTAYHHALQHMTAEQQIALLGELQALFTRLDEGWPAASRSDFQADFMNELQKILIHLG